jgi:hypothetical protein
MSSMAKKSGKGRKLGKNEKLDLILAEIGNLKAEIRSLGKQQAAPQSGRAGKPAAAKASSKPAKGKTPAAKAPARKPQAAPKRPVLVAAAETNPAAPRAAAQS